MRRFVCVVALLFFAAPIGVSLIGCSPQVTPTETTAACSGSTTTGQIPGQVSNIVLSQALAQVGESLNYGQIGQTLSSQAYDCTGATVSVTSFVYSSTDRTIADINPANGEVCAGTWNRLTGGTVPDYTICSPPTIGTSVATITGYTVTSNVVTVTATNSFKQGQQITFAGLGKATFLNGQTLPVVSSTGTSFNVAFTTANQCDAASPTGVCNPVADSGTASPNFVAYVTSSAQGASSNVVPVFVHSTVTGVLLGNPTPTASCSTTNDPSSNCCSFNAPLQTGVNPYDGTSCLSQGTTAQLTGRVYAGAITPANNITCKVGRLSFAAQGATNLFTIDPSSGVITANLPGTAIITAQLAESGSADTSTIVSTCPPASILLTPTGKTGPDINVSLNNQQAFTTTVVDTKGVTLTGLNLEFESTNAQAIPTSGGTVTPIFPGVGTITAVCQPATCNPSPFSQIGLYGTGKPITSNGITIATAGNSSSVLYAGSTSSQFLFLTDFTTSQPAALIKLPYTPNSMVITLDGSTIYLGSPQGLMTFNTTSNALTSTNVAITGQVLAVSPDGTTLVISDAARQTTSLLAAATGGVAATYGAVGTTAKFSPDSQTVYITATNQQLLVHSAFSGWANLNTGGINYTDVALTVPHLGAYFAGGTDTEGRTACATTTVDNTSTPPTTTNSFYPVADTSGAHTDRIAATTDTANPQIVGASANPATLSDIKPNYPPPALACSTATGAVNFSSTFTPYPLVGIVPTAINSVVAATNSSVVFVTYNGTGGLLPLFVPSSGAAPTYVQLTGGATAPIAGVFATDNNTFYVGTSGDNNIHLISITGTTATDSSTLVPKLTDASGNIVAPNLIVQRPKKATS